MAYKVLRMARSRKKKNIKLSKRQYTRAVVFLLMLIVATFVWTTRSTDSKGFAPSMAAAESGENIAKTEPQAVEKPQSAEQPAASKRDSEFYLKTGGALELPYYNSSTFIIDNTEGRYTLMYDTARRSAVWVAYVLTRADVTAPSAGRSTSFKSDPYVVKQGWATAVTKDYTNTGYDRGHLLPSADRDFSREENSATFYLSNVAPQEPNLNRKVWKNLEEQVRDWAEDYDSLYVVTGTILGDELREINNGVDVPESFYKAMLVRVGGTWYSRGYLIPNVSDVGSNFDSYALSVDELETKTNLDLFHNLDSEAQDRAEATKNDNIFKR